MILRFMARVGLVFGIIRNEGYQLPTGLLSGILIRTAGGNVTELTIFDNDSEKIATLRSISVIFPSSCICKISAVQQSFGILIYWHKKGTRLAKLMQRSYLCYQFGCWGVVEDECRSSARWQKFSFSSSYRGVEKKEQEEQPASRSSNTEAWFLAIRLDAHF